MLTKLAIHKHVVQAMPSRQSSPVKLQAFCQGTRLGAGAENKGIREPNHLIDVVGLGTGGGLRVSAGKGRNHPRRGSSASLASNCTATGGQEEMNMGSRQQND
ncbi:unnamed protein product [Linum trigynum]|uniref:Uncharacterized protein n=1 Tax=Linum trigynum TaxID=586398 RepID=A0AAV2FIL9_9ROSI